MITNETFRELALSFTDAVEHPHFERTSFRLKKKIFATLAEDSGIATLKLSKPDQFSFSTINKKAVYPVPGKWGDHGWTLVELADVSEELMMEMLSMAYKEIKK